jgi:hypothetical protein
LRVRFQVAECGHDAAKEGVRRRQVLSNLAHLLGATGRVLLVLLAHDERLELGAALLDLVFEALFATKV